MKILFAFIVAGFVLFIASNLFEIRPTKISCSNPDLTCAFDVQGNNIVSIKRKGFPLDTFVEKRVQNNDQSEKLTVSSLNREVKRLNLFLNLVFWVGIFSVAGLVAYTINKKDIDMRILGIDPGTGIVGFGVIDKLGAELSMVDAGVITTKPNEEDSIRLNTIYDELSEIIAETKPEAMAVEKLFFAQNVTTAMSVSQARGVILLCGQQKDIPIFEYTPLQIKQALTGYGRADKSQIQEMVKMILKLNQVPKPDDCADALACAITHANTGRIA